MSSYQGSFDWMLDPRLQQRGVISPQTAALAQQRGTIPPGPGGMAGGYRPPASPFEQYMAQIRSPAQPAAFPAGSPVHALRQQLPQQASMPAAPAVPELVFPGAGAEGDFASTVGRVIGATKTKKKQDGGRVVSRLRGGAELQQAGILAEGAIAAEEAETKGAEYGKAISESRKLENNYASIERRRSMAERLAQHNMKAIYEESDTMEKYPAITPEQARHHQSVIDSPNTTPEQKTRSQAALKKAQEIDPERVYGGSTGRKVMAAIGMALGAYGAALAKTPNYAMEIVQNAIDRDIAAQRERFASQRQAARDKRTEAKTDYELIRTKFADELSQTEAMAAQHWRRFSRLMEQISVGYAAPEAKAKAMQMIGQAQQNAAEHEAGITARQGERALEEMKIEAAMGGRMKPTENQAQLRAAIANTDELISLRKKYGSEHFGGPIQNRMESLASSLKFALARLHGQGALQAPDREIVEEMLGNPAGFGWQLEKLQTARKIISRYQTESEGSPSPEQTASEIEAEYAD